MNIDTYKTFIALTEIKNYSKTAEKLNVVQSTVSARINELEKHLNVQLFKKNKKKFEITEAGKVFIPFAKKIISAEIEGMRSINQVSNIKECLHLGIPSSVFREVLSDKIYDFYNNHPEYALDIQFNKTTSQLDLLLNHEIDMGFISKIPNSNKLSVEAFLDYSWVLIARADYPIEDIIKASQLSENNLCYNNQNEEYNEWLHEMLPANFITRMNMNSTSELINYVKQGFGCAFLPSYAISQELKSGVFKQVEISDVKVNKFKIYLAINKLSLSKKSVQDFLDLLKKKDI